MDAKKWDSLIDSIGSGLLFGTHVMAFGLVIVLCAGTVYLLLTGTPPECRWFCEWRHMRWIALGIPGTGAVIGAALGVRGLWG